MLDNSRSSVCPCCKGAGHISKPIVDLNANTVAWNGMVAEVTPRQAEICLVLARNWGNALSTDALFERVYGAFSRAEALNNISVQVHLARPALKSIGLNIRGRKGRRSGYALEAA